MQATATCSGRGAREMRDDSKTQTNTRRASRSLRTADVPQPRRDRRLGPPEIEDPILRPGQPLQQELQAHRLEAARFRDRRAAHLPHHVGEMAALLVASHTAERSPPTTNLQRANEQRPRCASSDAPPCQNMCGVTGELTWEAAASATKRAYWEYDKCGKSRLDFSTWAMATYFTKTSFMRRSRRALSNWIVSSTSRVFDGLRTAPDESTLAQGATTRANVHMG